MVPILVVVIMMSHDDDDGSDHDYDDGDGDSDGEGNEYDFEGQIPRGSLEKEGLVFRLRWCNICFESGILIHFSALPSVFVFAHLTFQFAIDFLTSLKLSNDLKRKAMFFGFLLCTDSISSPMMN